MPNHVSNIIKMKGITKLPLFKEEREGDEIIKCFDFNKLIPMPESLNMESGSMTDISVVYYMTERCTIPVDRMDKDKKELTQKIVSNLFSSSEEWLKEVFNRAMVKAFDSSDKEKDKMYENGKVYVKNYTDYGATTWYDWCRHNWDTKWNAYSNEQIDEDTISFQTAWSCPEKVIEKLAEMYPDAHIEHWWADEDCGSNTGYREYIDGQWYGGYDNSCSNEAYERYIYCWGMSECLAKDSDGNWYHKSCEHCDGCN